jgi:hypothetical protein
MKTIYLYTLILAMQCSSIHQIKTAEDLKDLEKNKPLVYAKIHFKALSE